MVRPSGLAWRSLRHSPRRVALTVAGAALGVGLTVAVLCLASMARAGVEARIQEEFGGIDLVVGSMDGRTWFGPEDLAEIEAIAGVRDVGVAYFPFAGDPFETDQAIRYVGLSPHPGTLQLFKLPRPVGDDEVFVSDQMAADMGISAGQTVTLPFPDQPRTFRVGEIVSPPLRAGTPKLAYFSLRTMQDVAGQPGAITAFYIRLIDPRLKLQTADDIQEALERRHPGVARDLTVDMAFEADEARRTAGGLRSLGLLTGSLTLLVSALLVVGVTQFTLRERLQEIALLRAVGATLKQARRALLVEVLLLGGLGALTGTAAGIVLAPAVGRILSPALGVPLVTDLPSIGELLPAVLLGWGLQVAAVWIPVRRATRVPPVQAARQTEVDEAMAPFRWWVPLAALLGALLFQVLGAAVPGGRNEELLLFLALLSGLCGVAACFSLVWPVLRLAMLVMRPLLAGRGRVLLLALRNAESLQRQGRWTTVIIGSALAAAVVGFTLVRTYEEQQTQALRAQFPTPLVVATYIDTVAWEKGEKIVGLPGVVQAAAVGWDVGADWANASEYPVDPEFSESQTVRGGLRLSLVPVDMHGLADLGLVPPEALGEGPRAVITRAMARQTGLQVGDVIRLSGPAGERFPPITVDPFELRVAAVIPEPVAGLWDTDILVDHDQLPLREEADRLDKVLINFPLEQYELVEAELTALKAEIPELTWSTEEQARAALRERTRRQRAILSTGVGVLVLMGLLATVNTMAASLHGRRREHATLRAAGIAVPLLFRMVLAENLLLTAGALISGFAAGLSFLYLSVIVTAGWTIWIPMPLVGAVAGASLLTAVLVALFAARTAARTQVLDALRQE